MIFQDPYASVNPRMRIGDLVAEPLQIHGIGSLVERRSRVLEMLEVVGIRASARNRFPHEFSGGQLQRVGIARALILRPEFIVLDEPVSALDVSIQAQILNLLDDLQGEYGLTYLFVAHDLGVVRQVSTRIAVMYLGQIVELADRDAIYGRPSHPYTAALLSAVPVPDPVKERSRRRIILKGDIPSPAAPPGGCRFHTRCWLREKLGRPERCETEMPELRQVADGTQARCHFAEHVGSASQDALAPGATLVPRAGSA
jgi:peptide/nickel transport system ATP-binding protein/oligopeptide transport system ATP-binding protein